jgi:hypothetical protein
VQEVTAMAIHMLGGILCLLLLVGGCATPPLPGAAGEVSGPLRTIELYAKQPDQHERYGTAARDHLFASDREVHVHLRWVLPKSGSYVTKIVLRTPTGTVHGEREHRFEAKETFVFTWYRFTLPQGAEAQRLTGLWKVEVALAGAPVGQRPSRSTPAVSASGPTPES